MIDCLFGNFVMLSIYPSLLAQCVVFVWDTCVCDNVMIVTCCNKLQCFLPLQQQYEKIVTVISMKLTRGQHWYRDHVIKFTRWKHCAVERRARFTVPGSGSLMCIFNVK